VRAAVRRIHASDLARARETAAIVASALGVPLVGSDPRLRERSFGLFEGLTREECEARHPEHWRCYREDPARLPPGAEAADVVARRMRAALLDVARRGEAPALVVGHGSAIRVLVTDVTRTACAPLSNCAVLRLTVRLDADGAPRLAAAEPLEDEDG
jgi:broad specificity phosphatase PhoE